MARVRRIGLDLLPDAPHVDGHGRGVAVEGNVPELIEEPVAAEHDTRVRGEQIQEVELLRGELSRSPADADLAGAGVELEPIESEPRRNTTHRGALAAAQHRLHPRDDF